MCNIVWCGVLGHTLGLGWSQANINVMTHMPAPTSADYAGFPVMHFADPVSCVPIGTCYPNAAIPKMDDATSLARLYPAAGNSQPAGRVYGSVYFTDASGKAVQPMQGVNVVARLLVSGLPSRQYVVTAVSGFAFNGNAGNIINGYVDANGLRFDRWGSNDPALEGFYDLGQLMIPTSQTIAQYQLSVEPLDAIWSLGVGPYTPSQVTPSGVFAPVVVTVTPGSNAERDILMLQDEIAQPHPGSGSTYTNPAALPKAGGWGSWISGYGSTDFFQFIAQANRTASVAVTAIEETGQPTESKLLPVVGIWQLSDQSGNPAPASTPSAFNSTTFGMTRLDAQFSATDTYRVAVADYRGDGRPDYFYQASLLYSDTVTPARLSVAGGVTTLQGIGFKPGLQVNFGGNIGSVLSASATQIQVIVPAAPQDGLATIQVTDSATGAFSQMFGALTYGALATDRLLLLQGSEPSTPIGSQAANAIRVRAVAADGVTPVNGATIAWSAANGLQFSICNGSSSCSALSDAAGEASSWVTPTAIGTSTITTALAPVVYSPPQSQQATVVGTSSALDLVALSPTRWVGQGATIAIPLTVEVLDLLGVPKANVTINFTLTKGTASLSAGSAITNGTGFASITVQVSNQNSDVQVSACVAPGNSPCQTFTLFSTSSSLWTLETVGGSSQAATAGQPFQPLVMRVTDGSLAANPVIGVTVTFATTLGRVSPGQGGGGPPGGDALLQSEEDPVLLGSSQAQVVTDQNGLASIAPSAGNVGPCDVFITVSAGQSKVQFQLENLGGIVLPPKNVPVKAPTTPRGTQFGMQTAALPSVPELLIAVPEATPLAEPAAIPDACPDAHQNGAPGAALDDGGPRSCPQLSEVAYVKAETPLSPAAPPAKLPTNPPLRNRRASATQQPAEVPAVDVPGVDNVAARRLLEDKRSCRFAQGEDGIVFRRPE
jgi:hypothetical protein